MKIGLLTYNTPHRKTQDVLLRLLAKGYDVTLVAQPFTKEERPEPIYPHRPTGAININPKELSTLIRCDYIVCDHNHLNRLDCDVYIIGGAKIITSLPKAPVINSHPGVLPYTRGLDSFKWAIYHGLPIGVTVHIIDEKIDSGHIIYREEIQKEPAEQFYHLAMRLYDFEINALVEHFNDSDQEIEQDFYTEYPDKPFTRMSHIQEVEMMKRYKYKNC